MTGLGVGALLDGIVLHQVLQWHHLWSSRIPDATVEGLRDNTLADGIFHIASLLVLITGVLLLAGVRVAPRALTGFGMMGWGLFHAIDHLVFHLALEAHHIRMVENHAVYDWSFFAGGVVLFGLGVMIARRRGHGAT